MELKKGDIIWKKTKDDRQKLRVLDVFSYPNGNFDATCEHLYYESIGKRSAYAECYVSQNDQIQKA